MNCNHVNFAMNRRDFFGRFGLGLGGAALVSLLRGEAAGAEGGAPNPFRGILPAPHHAPRAKRVISLFMSGGPSQHDLFDYKPLLNQMNGQELPDSVRMGQRLTGMSSSQASLPLAGSIFKFARQGTGWRLDERSPPLDGEGRRRALLRQIGPHRGDQPRPGHHLLPDRLADRRPAEPGGLAELWARGSE